MLERTTAIYVVSQYLPITQSSVTEARTESTVEKPRGHLCAMITVSTRSQEAPRGSTALWGSPPEVQASNLNRANSR